MKRLIARMAEVDEHDFEGGFVPPVRIATWVSRLNGIKPVDAAHDRIPERHQRNIGYRLQLMEFECALLLLNIETYRRDETTTLHSTVSAMKTQQFIGLAYSVLEGIGAHLFRAEKRAAGEDVDQQRNVHTNDWHAAIVRQLVRTMPEHAVRREELHGLLAGLKAGRDRIHLDRVDPHEEELHFDRFYPDEVFLSAYRAFRTLMGGLCPRWPDCCLNEAQW